MRLLALLFAFLLPQTAFAVCSGTDLRDTLTDAERAAIADYRASTPFAEGNHWLARRGGQNIHIIGTMHLDDPRWPPIVERLKPVVEQAELLMVEMTDEEQQRMQQELARNPEFMFITDGPTLPDRMEADDWDRLSQAMRERGMPPFMVAKTQPWFLSLLLGIPACAMAQGEAAQNGLDKRLIAIAEASDVPRAGLEGYEMLISLLADLPVEEQLDMLLASLPMAEQADDQFATVAAQYFDEDSAGAWGMAQVIARRSPDMTDAEIATVMQDLQDRLLDRRNTAWMDEILGRTESRIVIAVGALHLMGENGVLNYLRQAGYTLERQPF